MKQYQNKEYELAYNSFNYYRQVFPNDTTAIYYTGLAAYNANNYPASIVNYKKLLTTNYSQNVVIYDVLSSAYLLAKDTVSALTTVEEGLSKYPGNGILMKKEIEISLLTGNGKMVLDKIGKAISNDPKNKTLYYYAGLVYSSQGDDYTQQSKTAKSTQKAFFKQKANENYQFASQEYKQALNIDPNYYDATLNLGYVLLSPAIDAYNTANNLPANNEKEYKIAMAKAAQLFENAGPYLKLAVQINPRSTDALANLLTYYRGTFNSPMAAKIKERLDNPNADYPAFIPDNTKAPVTAQTNNPNPVKVPVKKSASEGDKSVKPNNYTQPSKVYAAPIISITMPVISKSLTVSQDNEGLRIEGFATDETGIVSVTVNDFPCKLAPNGKFVGYIPIQIGDNEIRIIAHNNVNKVSYYTFNVNRNIVKKELQKAQKLYP